MRRTALARTSALKPGRGFAASAAQRMAVMARECVNCGHLGCDPAHLTPRSQGGCDDELCVIALCRVCHDGLDRRSGARRDIDLSPVLALPEFAAERAHMASHLSFDRCLMRLSGRRVELV